MSEVTRQLLNLLVDQGFTAQVPGSSSMSSLLRWGEDGLPSDRKKAEGITFINLRKDEWFLFEIGRNCGTVFSANIVESIEIKNKHCVIRFKK